MFLLFGIAVFTLGALLIIAGRRSGADASYFNCGHCGYDLTGASQPVHANTPLRCPECGLEVTRPPRGFRLIPGLPSPRAAGAHLERRYRGHLVVGFWLMAFGLFFIWGFTSVSLRNFQWRAHAPVWVLAWLAQQHQGPIMMNQALTELVRRDNDSELSRAQRRYLARIASQVQPNTTKAGETRWFDLIASAIDHDALTPSESLAYYKNLVVFKAPRLYTVPGQPAITLQPISSLNPFHGRLSRVLEISIDGVSLELPGASPTERSADDSKSSVIYRFGPDSISSFSGPAWHIPVGAFTHSPGVRPAQVEWRLSAWQVIGAERRLLAQWRQSTPATLTSYEGGTLVGLAEGPCIPDGSQRAAVVSSWRAFPVQPTHIGADRKIGFANLTIASESFAKDKAYAYEIFVELMGESQSVGFYCAAPGLLSSVQTVIPLPYPKSRGQLSLTLRPTESARLRYSSELLERGVQSVCPDELRVDLLVVPEATRQRP